MIKEIFGFIKELHRRNPIFFYVGITLTFLFILFLLTYEECMNSLSTVCQWLKPCKFTISFAMYVFTLGWYLEYLKDTLGQKKIKIVTWLISFILLAEVLVILLQILLTSDSYARFLYLLGNSIIVSDSVVVAYITFYFFRQIALKPEAYLWAIRASFVVLLLSSLLGVFMVEHYGQMAPNLSGYGFPITPFSSSRDQLIFLHFLGIHYLQGLPFCCYFFPKYCGKKFVLFSVGIYIVACLFLIFRAY